MAAGLALGGGGTAIGANAASKKRKQLLSYQQSDLPNIPLYTQNYFGDLAKYEDQSRGMAMRANEDLTNLALSRQERALPGVRSAVTQGFESLMPLLRGELPESVLNAFRTSGAAGSVGLGFSGSGFGDLNQALFGARGSLQAMQMGYAMLPALLGAAPQFNTVAPNTFLEGIMTPGQQAQTQLGVRGQNVNIAMAGAGMPTSSDMWAQYLQSTGGMLTGAGMMGMGGGGGGGISSSGISSGGLKGGGAAGGFGGGGWAGGMA